MISPSDILGMNARQSNYTSQNSKTAQEICSSKYATKILLQSKQIPTAELHGIFTTIEDFDNFNWLKMTNNFVIKPTNGNAGKGVIVFKKKNEKKMEWTDALGKVWNLDDIKWHCSNILEGQYSTYGGQHYAIVEERVLIHPKLLKYTYRGTPDVRVIVYNSVPVMALLRLPTKESEGRANQSQGAIGVGIDMATGITTYAAANLRNLIRFLPNTKKKLNGIKIPRWNELLKTAVIATNAADLNYSGIDLFIHETKGPMVVELNANPGLSIQIANKAGLRRRLERVEDLNVRNPEHGVKISQALFAESFADKIKAEDGLTIVNPKETITVFGDQKKQLDLPALISTGRFRSAISSQAASELGLIDLDDLLWFQQEKDEGKVPVVEVKFKLKHRTIKTAMIVSKTLNKSRYKLKIGRKDLISFLVRSETLNGNN